SRSVEEEIAVARDHLDMVQRAGAKVFIAAETSNAIHGANGTPLAESPVLNADEMKRFGENMERFAAYLASEGLPLVYHH
ncbi:MAG: myo-inosose-2 dehydratase, partial [Allorhizobium sp.]